MVKTKDLSEAMFMKNCQFLGETLHSEGKTSFFESNNQPSITNAKAGLIAMKVFTKRSNYINLSPEYTKSTGEKRLIDLIAQIGVYRMKPSSADVFDEVSNTVSDLRRHIIHDF